MNSVKYITLFIRINGDLGEAFLNHEDGFYCILDPAMKYYLNTIIYKDP